MKSPALKKILATLGNIFTLAAVFYLLVTLLENANRLKIEFSSVLLVVAVLFCCTHCIQAFIIQLLLNKKTGYRALLKIHCISQVYKYVPGNVAHYFSRWLYLRRQGVDARDNARLILNETLLLVASFGLLGVAFLAVAPRLRVPAALPHPAVIACIGLAALVLAGYFFRKKTGAIFNVKNIFVMLLYGLSALLSGAILCLLSAYMVPDLAGIGFVQYTLGFAVSFLAGFVVPGSPGGIGIREFVFVEIFTYGGCEAYLVTQVIVLYRLMAIVVELLMYCMTKWLVKDTA